MKSPFKRLGRILGRWWTDLRKRLPDRVIAWVDRWQGDGDPSVAPDAPAPAGDGVRTRPPPATEALTLEGSVRVSAGWISTAPLTVPRRDYLLRLPAGYDPRLRWPLLVWIHGCRQSPEDFRDGTRIAAHMDAAGMVLLMPRQTRAANPMRCWNWFEPATVHGEGEVALVLAQMDQVGREYAIDVDRVAIAGISSGAALAVALTVNAPTRIRALISMAGLACGIAGPLNAAEVMRDGPRQDTPRLPVRPANARPGTGTRSPTAQPRVDALIVQGGRDTVVAPVHAIALARQILALDGAPSSDTDPECLAGALPDTRTDHSETLGDRTVRVRDFHPEADVLVRLMEVEGLGHAWPGGDPKLAYHEAAGPDLSAMAVEFAKAAFARTPHAAGASTVTWTTPWRRRRRTGSEH